MTSLVAWTGIQHSGVRVKNHGVPILGTAEIMGGEQSERSLLRIWMKEKSCYGLC